MVAVEHEYTNRIKRTREVATETKTSLGRPLVTKSGKAFTTVGQDKLLTFTNVLCAIFFCQKIIQFSSVLSLIVLFVATTAFCWMGYIYILIPNILLIIKTTVLHLILHKQQTLIHYKCSISF